MSDKELIAEARGIGNWALHETGPEGEVRTGPTLFARLVYALEAAGSRAVKAQEMINAQIERGNHLATLIPPAESPTTVEWGARFEGEGKRISLYTTEEQARSHVEPWKKSRTPRVLMSRTPAGPWEVAK